MFIFKSDKYIIPIEEIDFWENRIFDKDTKDQKKNKLAMNMINNAIDNVENKSINEKLLTLVNDIPAKYLEVAENIIKYAELKKLAEQE